MLDDGEADGRVLLAWPPLPDGIVQSMAAPGLGGWRVLPVDDTGAAAALLRQSPPDLCVVAPDLCAEPGALGALVQRTAVVLQIDAASQCDTVAVMAWYAAGVQDAVTPGELASPGAALRLAAAALRQRLAHAARTAYATDLATGLPHQQQLLEHMSHLLALREREPAPMALLVLRVEGLATTEARLGSEAAGALRRKLAVRLRSGLRASDVVASIGQDSFAVLLAWIDTLADVDGVAAKLVRSVQRPFTLAGQAVALAVSVGQGRYPDDGKDAASLLQRALEQAAAAPGQGRAGHSNVLERGPATAANDDNG